MDFKLEISKAAERVALQKIVGGQMDWVGNHDIRNFIIDQLGLATTTQVFQAVSQKFGTRAPSRSAIGRFYKAVRDEIKTHGGLA